MDKERRGFLAGLAVTGGALVLSSPAEARALKRHVLQLSKHPPLQRVKGWVVTTVGKLEVLLIRVGKTDLRAFHARCTHKSCRVGFMHQTRQIACGCHGSKYDLTGQVEAGPAPRALPRYPATLAGDRVILELP